MKLERSKNAVRNAYFGVINKLITTILPFAVRTVFIQKLGAEYLGLNSLFGSILTVLNLTELGFSSAIVFCMYKPIADDDDDTICALLLFYKKIYISIGFIITAIGLMVIPFLPVLVKGSYPSDINIGIVYLAYLFNTVISYFLFAYLGSLITAFQREDVNSKINTVISLVMYASQIIILYTFHNYYAYIAIMPVFAIINNLRTAIIAKRMFPQYKPCGKISNDLRKDIKEKVSGLFVQKICAVSRNAFDSIFVSMFLGLTETAMYNNYYFLMNSVTALMVVLTNSITAGAGNSVAMESPEKNYSDMENLDFWYMWLSGWCTCCLLCLFQPFMKLWVGERLMLPITSVVLFSSYFYALKLGDIRYIYTNAAGLWWVNRYRAILEAILNLLLNYFLGKYFGINGIIFATLITILLINFIYGGQIIFTHYFTNISFLQYFKYHFQFGVVTAVVCGITYGATSFLPYSTGFFIVRVVICIALPNAIYFLLYRKMRIYQKAQPWLLNKLSGRSSKILGLLLR